MANLRTQSWQTKETIVTCSSRRWRVNLEEKHDCTRCVLCHNYDLTSPCAWFHTCQCHIQNRGNLCCIHWRGMFRVWRADVDHCPERFCVLAPPLFSPCTKLLREHLNLWADRLLSYSKAGAGFLEPDQVKVPDQSLWLVKSAPCQPASVSPQTLEDAGMAVAAAASGFLFGKLPLPPIFFYLEMDLFLRERKSTSAIIKTVMR